MLLRLFNLLYIYFQQVGCMLSA